MYLKIVSALVPRELISQRERDPDFADLSDDEVNGLLRAEGRRRLIEIGLETVQFHRSEGDQMRRAQASLYAHGRHLLTAPS